MADHFPLGNPLVPYGTPLHITELFLRLLKMTFAEFPEGHPLRYNPDDYEKSGIAFDVSLNKESGIYGKKPLVVVRRGSQQCANIVLGDTASVHVPTSNGHGSNTYVSTIEIQILSRVKAEAEIIGQYVFNFMLFARTHFPALTGLHMVQNIMLSEVSRMEDDDAMFTSSATFAYTGQYIWARMRNDPVLRSVGVAIQKIQQATE